MSTSVPMATEDYVAGGWIQRERLFSLYNYDDEGRRT